MFATQDRLVFTAGDVRTIVDVGAGGRVCSLTVGDVELIWSGADGAGDADPLVWGMYPMVPFAGRILRGEFTFDGVEYAVPQFQGPNAIHGYGFVNAWRQLDDTTIGWEFAEPWPFAGRATQRFSLSPNALTVEMMVTADDRQPLGIGWHPWFIRETSAGAAQLSFPATSMYQRDADGMPGALIPAPPGPWDDCFTNLTGLPTITWGDVAVTLRSSFDHWVVYDEPEHAFCVEPQSGPPNEINTSPRILEAGETLTAFFTLEFSATRNG